MIRFNKGRDRKQLSVDDTEIIAFYTMLLKYKRRHPNFNVTRIISKLYPKMDFKSIMSNQK